MVAGATYFALNGTIDWVQDDSNIEKELVVEDIDVDDIQSEHHEKEQEEDLPSIVD